MVIEQSTYEDTGEYDVPPVPQAYTKKRKLVVDKNKYFELIDYEPHGRQWLFHRSKARFKVAVCGRRFGKTLMTAKDIQPILLVPNKRVWLVGQTYALAEKEFRVIWDDMIVGLGFGQDKTVQKGYNLKQGNMFIKFPWNTVVEAKSAERSETLVGDSLDLVVMCEAAKHSKETWERFIQPALSDRRGTAVFTTTPQGMDWIYELWQYGQNPRPEYSMYESWQFPSWENEIIYPGGLRNEEIQLMKLTMPDDYFQQEIAASFTSFSGRIYSEFAESSHVKPHTFNPAWPNYVCFDFGFVNPLAAIEFQIDPQDRVHIWREHYKRQMRLEDHLEYMKQRDQPDGYRIDLCFGDAADPEAVLTVNEKFAPCIADPLSKSNWREGIDLVKAFLKLQNGESWLTVDHSCKDTIREFNNYQTPNTGKSDRNPREEAKKFDDHAMDAIRYGLMHIFKLGARHSLGDVITIEELRASANHDRGYVSMTETKFPSLQAAGFVTFEGGQRF